MSTPHDPTRPTLYGFAGRPVDPPPPNSTTEQALAHWYRAGYAEADTLINDVVAAYRHGQRTSLHVLIDQATTFQPAFEPPPIEGLIPAEGSVYAAGLCAAAMAEVHRLETGLLWLHQQHPGLAHAAITPRQTQQAERWNGTPSANTLGAIIDTLTSIADVLAHNATVAVPEITHVSWHTSKAARAALAELATMIDDYHLMTTAPRLRTPERSDGPQMLRDRIDLIVVLAAKSPDLVASLSQERADILISLVPEIASRRHVRNGSDLVAGPFSTDYERESLTAIGDELTARILRPESIDSPADRSQIKDLVGVARQTLLPDPNLTVALKPLPAGLLHHLVRNHAHLDTVLDQHFGRSQPRRAASLPASSLAWQTPATRSGQAAAERKRLP